MRMEDKIREYYQQQVKNALEKQENKNKVTFENYGTENCKREPIQW